MCAANSCGSGVRHFSSCPQSGPLPAGSNLGASGRLRLTIGAYTACEVKPPANACRYRRILNPLKTLEVRHRETPDAINA